MKTDDIKPGMAVCLVIDGEPSRVSTFTVRALLPTGKVRVDDGDPDNPDKDTNGRRYSLEMTPQELAPWGSGKVILSAQAIAAAAVRRAESRLAAFVRDIECAIHGQQTDERRVAEVTRLVEAIDLRVRP